MKIKQCAQLWDKGNSRSRSLWVYMAKISNPPSVFSTWGDLPADAQNQLCNHWLEIQEVKHGINR